ncbi:MAG TPA: iron-sulfur cluster assembly protein [Phycisphaerae bacterium]|jgi:FeS assembly SUF system protein
MTDSSRIPLSQAPANDHAARILQEKIGDILSLGDAPPAASTKIAATSPDQQLLEEKIIDALKTIYDPEIPLNIYDLGLIYKITLDPVNAVAIEMTLTAPGCPVAGDIIKSVQQKIESIPEVPRVQVSLVWDPPWTRERLSEAARLELNL